MSNTFINRHINAFHNAKNALIHAQEDMFALDDSSLESEETFKEKVQNEYFSQSLTLMFQVVTLAIAYHNLGAEEEHLKNFNNALSWYEKAYLVFDEHGIVDEKLYNKFKNVFLAAHDV